MLSRVCVCVHVCSSTQLYHLCGFLKPPPQSRHRAAPSPQVSLCCPPGSCTTSTGQALSSSPLYQLVILRISYAWNLTLCNLWWLAFSFSTTPLWTIQVIVYISSWFLFIAMEFSKAGMYHCSAIGLLKETGFVSSLWLLRTKLLSTLCYERFSMNMGFHFSWIKAWESNWWIIW